MQPADLKWASDLDDSQYQLLQVALDNHILHRAHRNLQEVCISGIREMPVDFLLGIAVQRPEFIHEIFAGLFPVIGRTLVVHEAVRSDGADCYLFLEQVHLVEEENEVDVNEEFVGANGFPEVDGVGLVGRESERDARRLNFKDVRVDLRFYLRQAAG